MKVEIVEKAGGRWRIYEEPKVGYQYFVIGDSASGIPGRNKSAACILCFDTYEVVGMFAQEANPDDFKEELEMAARCYNNAEIVVELEKYGMVVLHMLRGTYQKIYSHSDDMVGYGAYQTKTLGWNPVVARNRQVAIDLLRVDIGRNLSEVKEEREKAIKIPDKEALLECQNFIRNKETGKEEAAPGKFDDMVATLWIGAFVWHERMQYWHPPKEEKKVTVAEMLMSVQKRGGRSMGGRKI